MCYAYLLSSLDCTGTRMSTYSVVDLWCDCELAAAATIRYRYVWETWLYMGNLCATRERDRIRMPNADWTANIDTALASSAAALSPGVVPRVWLDIGTSDRTLTKWDVEQNESLVVVGVDILKRNIDHEVSELTWPRAAAPCVALVAYSDCGRSCPLFTVAAQNSTLCTHPRWVHIWATSNDDSQHPPLVQVRESTASE